VRLLENAVRPEPWPEPAEEEDDEDEDPQSLRSVRRYGLCNGAGLGDGRWLVVSQREPPAEGKCPSDSTGVAFEAETVRSKPMSAPLPGGLPSDTSRLSPLVSPNAPATVLGRLGVEGGTAAGSEPLPVVGSSLEAGFDGTARSPATPFGTDCTWEAMRFTIPGFCGATACTTSVPAVSRDRASATSI
jgi:hypothetical protein